MIPAMPIIESDCTILLERALLGKTLCAFGEDGCGKFGQCTCPKFFTVTKIDFKALSNDVGLVHIDLAGYDSRENGLVMTDRNFEIALANHLKVCDIPPGALRWCDENMQGHASVGMYVQIDALLG